MTPQLRAKVLELFGVPECRDCGGEGEVDHRYFGGTCTNCDGAGRRLADATREGWPWWQSGGIGGFGYANDYAPVIPDFATDDGAAVKLAEQMARILNFHLKPRRGEDDAWLVGHRRLKIYGRLDCPSALRWLARGHYARHRVFFAREADAVAAGYRPCARCMPAEHAEWKKGWSRLARATPK